jgi:hypothetical protein
MLNLMKQTCREMTSSLRRRQLAVTELLRHARIVTDPKTLAYLDAEVARRREGQKAPLANKARVGMVEHVALLVGTVSE